MDEQYTIGVTVAGSVFPIPVAEITDSPAHLSALRFRNDTFRGDSAFHGCGLAGFSRNEKMPLNESCRT